MATAVALHWITPAKFLEAYPGALRFLQDAAQETGDAVVMREVNFRRDLLATYYGFGDELDRSGEG